MTTNLDLDLDDVADGHPLALRELAALRSVLYAAELIQGATHDTPERRGLV